MHFIGMLAFQLPIPVYYHLGLTALSMLPSLLAAYCALNLLARPSITKPRLLIGGVLVGAGIGAMHYIGMAAMIAACVMGVAISGMHYIAMHAAVFVDTGVFSAVVVGRDTNQLVWGIVLVTFTIIVLVVILNALVLMHRLYRNSQESARIKQ
ncbi:MAG: hypothetical protein M1473_11055 [Firmicutes bacterium]|nr:hypothetical protein [Bacillota bacterium]